MSEDKLKGMEKNILSGPPEKLLEWDPPNCGEIDIYIDNDGNWFHEGVAFTRMPLVQMFAGILRKEEDGYYLVTPVEKWKIRVADVPFLVVDYRLVNDTVVFTTSLGDQVSLTESNPVVIREGMNNTARPYIHVRHGIYALIGRSVYYNLAERILIKNNKHGILSGGCFFPLE